MSLWGKTRASCNVKDRGAKAIGVGKRRRGISWMFIWDGSGSRPEPSHRAGLRGRARSFACTKSTRPPVIFCQIAPIAEIRRIQHAHPVAAICLFAARWEAVSVPRSSSDD